VGLGGCLRYWAQPAAPHRALVALAGARNQGSQPTTKTIPEGLCLCVHATSALPQACVGRFQGSTTAPLEHVHPQQEQADGRQHPSSNAALARLSPASTTQPRDPRPRARCAPCGRSIAQQAHQHVLLQPPARQQPARQVELPPHQAGGGRALPQLRPERREAQRAAGDPTQQRDRAAKAPTLGFMP
jgi:hypothetical protein